MFIHPCYVGLKPSESPSEELECNSELPPLPAAACCCRRTSPYDRGFCVGGAPRVRARRLVSLVVLGLPARGIGKKYRSTLC